MNDFFTSSQDRSKRKHSLIDFEHTTVTTRSFVDLFLSTRKPMFGWDRVWSIFYAVLVWNTQWKTQHRQTKRPFLHKFLIEGFQRTIIWNRGVVSKRNLSCFEQWVLTHLGLRMCSWSSSRCWGRCRGGCRWCSRSCCQSGRWRSPEMRQIISFLFFLISRGKYEDERDIWNA